MLSLKDIKKDYVVGDSTVSALKGVSIDFRENEFVSILGPSGCGKTTLLNIIGGLDRYTSGDLNINGKSTKDFKDCDWDSYRNHSIGFVFQSYNLIPHQTVLSNVELALTLSGVSKSERRERAVKALEQVGLGDQLHKKPNQMSGGQMQRVAIARALVNEPDILLADEPTGALDTETSVQIMELLKSISKDKLIIMVTHNPELAMKYSSRIIKLLDGKVIDDSDPLDKNVVEPIKKPEKEPTKADKKAAKKERKKLKTSMSFLTALSLSQNNLMTKKARTLLTSFAGSIGIIGIALILSISNGVQLYIDQVQSDTLSSYPLQITKTTASIGEIMNTMAKNHEGSGKHDMDKVYSQNAMGEMINTLMEETKVNNLEKFKKYLDDNSDLKDLTSDVQYTYATTLNVFTESDRGVMQVNPSTLLEDMGYMSSTQMEAMSRSGSMGGMMGMGTDVWSEMIDNEELIDKQYDVIAGRLPEKYNEVVLVVDKNNEINDYVLYSLGLLDPSSLNGIVRRAMAGEDISVDSEQHVYTYDELLDLTAKTPYHDILKKYKPELADGHIDYAACELSLRTYYSGRLVASLHKFGGETEKRLKSYLGTQIDTINIANAYRMIHFFNADQQTVKSRMIPVYLKIPERKMDELYSAQNDQEFLKTLAAGYYGREMAEQGIDMAEPDTALARLRFKQTKRAFSSARSAPECFFTFNSLAEVEVKNIIRIIEGIRYDLPAKEISELLIT